jgi:hypothetical protein
MNVQREIIHVIVMQHAQILLARTHVNVILVILVMEKIVCLCVIHRA